MHKYKEGDMPHIKGNTNEHGFEIGEQVQLTSGAYGTPNRYNAKSLKNGVKYIVREIDLTDTTINTSATVHDPFYQGDMD